MIHKCFLSGAKEFSRKKILGDMLGTTPFLCNAGLLFFMGMGYQQSWLAQLLLCFFFSKHYRVGRVVAAAQIYARNDKRGYNAGIPNEF
jgi:hypothetical protein